MRFSYWSWTGTPQAPVLDGSVLDHYSSGDPNDTSPGYATQLELCEGVACDDVPEDLQFESCNPDYPIERHTITFDRGQIVLDVRITGEVGGAEMVGAFTAASGTLDGMAFTQKDYFKLVYSADHHHMIRSFAVLFDAPIAGACGLNVLNLWANRTGAPLPEAHTIQCDLSSIAALTVASAVIEFP